MICRHAEGEGMCRNCQPEMFPTEEQEAAYAEWFVQWRFGVAMKELMNRPTGRRLPKYDRPSTFFKAERR